MKEKQREREICLVLVDSAFLHGVKKIFHATEDIKELIDPYVNFAFAGQQVSADARSPRWS